MKTFIPKQGEIQKNWLVIDAEGLVLGRLAVEVSKLLRGKHKTNFTPFLDCGDHVIVINAEKIRVTGNKLIDRKFYYHTGFIGGIKELSFGHILAGRHPERLLMKAVERMVHRGPLGRQQMSNLRVYKGAEHPHAAQNPTVYDFGSKNIKNKRAA